MLAPVGKAMLLDVGGVLLLPHLDPVRAAMAAASIDFDETKVPSAHYFGVHALDESDRSEWEPEVYLHAYVAALGVTGFRISAAVEALLLVWADPTVGLWRHRVTDSIDSLALLAGADVPLAIVSNSDGTVERELRALRICQTGAGDGVQVACITDSAVVGVSKPDPAVFAPALRALRIDPGEGVYVGDTERYDVRGATLAGLEPVHFDPLGLCRHPRGHRHVASLRELVPGRHERDGAAGLDRAGWGQQ
ncbi:MAG TPA: HAD family hydrolase [Acidimicrobiales bacterium]|nr:HAD family hydrolase [Acidimicrobiales bacterium]